MIFIRGPYICFVTPNTCNVLHAYLNTYTGFYRLIDFTFGMYDTTFTTTDNWQRIIHGK